MGRASARKRNRQNLSDLLNAFTDLVTQQQSSMARTIEMASNSLAVLLELARQIDAGVTLTRADVDAILRAMPKTLAQLAEYRSRLSALDLRAKQLSEIVTGL